MNDVNPTPAAPAQAIPNATPAVPDPNVRVVFFCKDCGKTVEAVPIGRKFVYRCKICNTKNVAFGTEKSIKNFYHIKDPHTAFRSMTEEEKKAMNADKL